MKQSIWTTSNVSSKSPQAFIAKDKHRLKQFSRNVYLSDGDEYQIELFNPTTQFTLAKIKIDDEYISDGGVVLRPGERVFLERYLDSNNKFVFKTYSVSSKDVEVLSAIRNNGRIDIEFYYEYKSNSGVITTTGGIFSNTFSNHHQTNWPGTNGSNTTMLYNYNVPVGSTTTTFSNNANFSSNTINANVNYTPRKMETGVTEKGDSSNQSFINSNREFLSYHSTYVGWQILPTSQKQHTSDEVRILYCGECGSKRKKDTFKFCPHCGTKF
jgi:hypothetical protein